MVKINGSAIWSLWRRDMNEVEGVEKVTRNVFCSKCSWRSAKIYEIWRWKQEKMCCVAIVIRCGWWFNLNSLTAAERTCWNMSPSIHVDQWQLILTRACGLTSVIWLKTKHCFSFYNHTLDSTNSFRHRTYFWPWALTNTKLKDLNTGWQFGKQNIFVNAFLTSLKKWRCLFVCVKLSS